MPIVSTSEGAEPNDDFIEQLTMNAEAAVKVISEMGVGDPNRVAVGGHSYGAFMTANLLTHTKLFKAGIARSGATTVRLPHSASKQRPVRIGKCRKYIMPCRHSCLPINYMELY